MHSSGFKNLTFPLLLNSINTAKPVVQPPPPSNEKTRIVEFNDPNHKLKHALNSLDLEWVKIGLEDLDQAKKLFYSNPASPCARNDEKNLVYNVNSTYDDEKVLSILKYGSIRQSTKKFIAYGLRTINDKKLVACIYLVEGGIKNKFKEIYSLAVDKKSRGNYLGFMLIACVFENGLFIQKITLSNIPHKVVGAFLKFGFQLHLEKYKVKYPSDLKDKVQNIRKNWLNISLDEKIKQLQSLNEIFLALDLSKNCYKNNYNILLDTLTQKAINSINSIAKIPHLVQEENISTMSSTNELLPLSPLSPASIAFVQSLADENTTLDTTVLLSPELFEFDEEFNQKYNNIDDEPPVAKRHKPETIVSSPFANFSSTAINPLNGHSNNVSNYTPNSPDKKSSP